MRKQIAHLAASVVAAAFVAACSGGPADSAGAKGRGTPRPVKLDGCVQAAPGIHQYVLQGVVTPVHAEQSAGGGSLPQEGVVPDGSWVRLARGVESLEPYLGKRVEVEGTITDTGEPTMGTTGEDEQRKLRRASPDASSTTDRSGPPSTVPPSAANANGFAPQVAVERIKKLAETCAPQLEKAAEGHTGLGGKRRAPPEDNPGPGSHR